VYRRNISGTTITIKSLVDREGNPLRLAPNRAVNFANLRRWDPRVVKCHRALLDRYVKIGEMSDTPETPKAKTKAKRRKRTTMAEVVEEKESEAPPEVANDIVRPDSEHSTE
jgi:hypothetical protein